MTPCRRPFARLWRLADRTKGAVETRDEPIGSAGRPRLQHAELLDAALLRRLQRRPARAKARRHPVVGVDLADHAPAIAVFAQDEFDELAARREQREPDRLSSAARQAARIGGKVLQHRRAAPAGAGRNPRQRAAPAFRNDDRAAFFEQAIRVGQICRRVASQAPLAGSSRHTEPEAFFSIRSRFQSAGPLVAEPLATSKRPSAPAPAR